MRPENRRARLLIQLVLLASLCVVSAETTHAQESPDVGLLQEALSLGIRIDGTCTRDQALGVVAAWRHLIVDLRDDANRRANFINCMLDAPLAEVGCDIQNDRDPLISAFLDTDYFFDVTCKPIRPKYDAFAFVAVEAAKLDIDPQFIMDNLSNPVRIASVIAHELAHNLGYTHFQNEFGTPLYDLTVPQQVRTCIDTDGTYNRPPYPEYLGRESCCLPVGSRYCSDIECFHTYNVECEIVVSPNEGIPCGTFFMQADGTSLTAAENRDALMCTHPGPVFHPGPQ